MQSLVDLMQTVLTAVGELAATDKVVGKSITVEGQTIIPLCKLSIGFGGAGGGGTGNKQEKKRGEAEGAGTGAGVTVEPVAVIAVTKDGVSLLSIGGRSGMLAQALEAVPGIVDKIQGRKGDKDEDED